MLLYNARLTTVASLSSPCVTPGGGNQIITRYEREASEKDEAWAINGSKKKKKKQRGKTLETSLTVDSLTRRDGRVDYTAADRQ